VSFTTTNDISLTETELRDLMATWIDTHGSFMDAVQDALTRKALQRGVSQPEQGDGKRAAIIYTEAGFPGGPPNYVVGESVQLHEFYVSWLAPHSKDYPGLVRRFKMRDRVLAVVDVGDDDAYTNAMVVMRGFIREGISQ
jgi:hypothetical protein